MKASPSIDSTNGFTVVSTRVLMVFLLVVAGAWAVFGSLAAPAWATEDPGPTEVTEETGETFDGVEPALIVESDDGPEVEPAWTFRYLVPTFLALMLLGVGVTALRWIRMRSKYKIVE